MTLNTKQTNLDIVDIADENFVCKSVITRVSLEIGNN